MLELFAIFLCNFSKHPAKLGLTLFWHSKLHFYRANICEGGLGSCNYVRPSVCLSHACIVTKLNDALQIFYTTRKGNHSVTLVPIVVGRRRPLPEQRMGRWVMGHGSNGSRKSDGSHGSWVTRWWPMTHQFFYRATLCYRGISCHRASVCPSVFQSVCLSQAGVVQRWLNLGSD